jgi:hypothetical protein
MGLAIGLACFLVTDDVYSVLNESGMETCILFIRFRYIEERDETCLQEPICSNINIIWYNGIFFCQKYNSSGSFLKSIIQMAVF